jgi:L-rhamnose mutarotase
MISSSDDMAANDSFEVSLDSHEAPSSHVEAGVRHAQLIRVKPEYQERYVVLHAHPFPELLEQLRDSNIRNYSIFLRDDLLFSFYEYVGQDYEYDMAALAKNPTVQDWWTLTNPMQESLAPASSDEWWLEIDEIYHGGQKKALSHEAKRKVYVSRLLEGTEGAVRRAYESVDSELEMSFAIAHIQNYAVYRMDNQIYTYFEYTGNQLEYDMRYIINNQSIKNMVLELSKLTKKSPSNRKLMLPSECVFYNY